MFQKIRWIVLFALLACPVLAIAATTRFDVQVEPSTFTAGEFADVTVKALDANGNVDTAYNEYVWMEIEGYDYTNPDIVLPAKGVGIFEPSDQGVKIFSKGLTIKKPGTYTLVVADVYDTEIQGTTEIEVLADNEQAAEGDIEVVSPASGGVETEDTITIIGTTSFPSTPLSIIMDGEKIEEGLSDENGDFTTYVSGIEPGEHLLEVNALDLEDNVVATAGPIPFTYEPDVTGTGELFLGVDVEPGTGLLIDEVMTFTVNTAPQVDSAMLKFGTGNFVPTQQEEEGQFTKQMSFSDPAEYLVDVRLSVDGNTTDYEDVELITISERDRAILSAEYSSGGSNKVDLSWTYTGEINYFKIKYGTSEDELSLSLTTSTPEGTLILAEPESTYYAQIYPVNQNGVTNGDPSEVLEIAPLQQGPVCGNGEIEAGEACDDGNTVDGDGCSSTCTVEIPEPVCGNNEVEEGEECDDGNAVDGDGCSALCQIEEEPTCETTNIRLQAQKINEKYYLTWEPIQNATEYIIYRSDTKPGAIGQMSVVGSTKDTMYEYPFDPMAEADKWARYAVEAVCDNGDRRQIGNMQQVKVGPEDTLLVILALALLSVVGLRLWKQAH